MCLYKNGSALLAPPVELFVVIFLFLKQADVGKFHTKYNLNVQEKTKLDLTC